MDAPAIYIEGAAVWTVWFHSLYGKPNVSKLHIKYACDKYKISRTNIQYTRVNNHSPGVDKSKSVKLLVTAISCSASSLDSNQY